MNNSVVVAKQGGPVATVAEGLTLRAARRLVDQLVATDEPVSAWVERADGGPAYQRRSASYWTPTNNRGHRGAPQRGY